MNGNLFKKKILNTIEQCATYYFLVKKDNSIKCTCVNHTTGQSDSSCKKCLGTGYKICIKKIRGACWEDVKGGETLSTKSSRLTRTYYFPPETEMSENDYIIDQAEIYYIYRLSTLRGVGGYLTHKEVTTVLKTEDHNKIYNNFINLINKKLTPKQKEDFPWLI